MLAVVLSLDVNAPSTGYRLLAVAVGGSLGAVLRFLVSCLLLQLPSPIPVPTLVVNALGCFLIGLTTALLARSSSSLQWVADLLETGLYGGLTTFSTFCLETVLMAEEEQGEKQAASPAAAAAAGGAGAPGAGSAEAGSAGCWSRLQRSGPLRAVLNVAVQNSLCLGLVFFGLAIPSGFQTTVAPQ